MSLAQELAAAIVRVAEEPLSLGRADPAVYSSYQASEVAKRFAAIFNMVAHMQTRAEHDRIETGR